MPPPPPPPPGPPPAPAFSPANFKTSDNPEKGRNMLLESIRQGKALKKTTVVNDRSAPIVDTKANGSSASANVNATVGNRGNGLNIPPGLGGLFAGGMPKLKSVGSPIKGPNNGNVENNSSIPRNASNNSLNSNNDSRISPNSSTPASPSVTPAKHAPPQPPPSSLKPSINTSGPPPPPAVQEERRNSTNFGKPSVAPKPPAVINGAKPARPNPPPKLYIPSPPPGSPSSSNSGQNSASATPPAGVNRAQSMRVPKSESPTKTNVSSPDYKTVGRNAGRIITGNSTGVQPPPPPRIMNGGQRPRQSIRPPAARPPPPPQAKAPPLHAPPPPPANIPPPPPHRAAPPPMPQQLRVNGVATHTPQNLNCPPPPPTRNSSMRSITSTTSVTSIGSSSGSSNSSTHTGINLESRFSHLFCELQKLPKPDLYTGIVKHYPSKNAQSVKRQPAPQPPTQLQLDRKMWPNNTSTC